MNERGNARIDEKSSVTQSRPAAIVGSGVFPNVARAIATTATTLNSNEEMSPLRVRDSLSHSLRKTAPISTRQFEFKRAEPPFAGVVGCDDEAASLALCFAYLFKHGADAFIEPCAWLI